MAAQKLERMAFKESELKDLLPLGASTIASLVADGSIRSVKVRGSRLIPADVLADLLRTEGGESEGVQ